MSVSILLKCNCKKEERRKKKEERKKKEDNTNEIVSFFFAFFFLDNCIHKSEHVILKSLRRLASTSVWRKDQIETLKRRRLSDLGFNLSSISLLRIRRWISMFVSSKVLSLFCFFFLTISWGLKANMDFVAYPKS